ncbi:hypothetical protein [Aurantimonas marina]|uniref:hypothetical protein n=1 Tax=Aurantimonas marina TaxID=2780508 RepID=UPI0019D1EB74|nr:hypothetical protein [Aurantimonas marina]
MTVSVNAVAAELADKFAPEEEAKKLMIARSIIKQCRAAGIPMILGPGLLREDGAISPAEGQPRGRGTIPFGGA